MWLLVYYFTASSGNTIIWKCHHYAFFFGICHFAVVYRTEFLCASKMSIFVPNNVFLRGVLLYYFSMKKTATESHRLLVKVYGDDALAEQIC